MDAGFASADNIAWLSERGYLYLVVSRERYGQDPGDQYHAVLVRETGQNTVSVYRVIDAETGETRLYCYSDQKAKKEQAIRNRFHVRLEEALDKLNAGLENKGTIKNYAKIRERIGRLREKTAVLRKTTALRSRLTTTKTTPPVLNGSVNPKVHKKTSTAVFTA